MYKLLTVLVFFTLLFCNTLFSSIKTTKRQLEETKKTIQQKQKQKELYIAYQKNLQSELRSIEQKLKQVATEIKNIKSEIEKTKTEIFSLEKKISLLTSDTEFYERLLNLLVRRYAEKYILIWRFYNEDFLKELDYKVITNFATELLDLRQTIIAVSKIKDEYEQKQRKLNEYYIQLVQKQKEQKLLFTKKSQLLNEYKSKQRDLEQEIAKLLKTQQELEKLLEKLRKEQKTKVRSVVNLEKKFPKPINGEIVEKFGKKQLSKDGACVIHNGVLIQGMSDVNVICVDDGKVLFVAENFRSYGKLVIVEHKGNIHTVYGQLGEIFVNEGANVVKGQIIGRTNSTGQLYFELRKDFIPLDPELYFE